MEVFTQFSSELDDSTKRQLAHGRVLMELLKQPLGHSLSMPEQVVLLQAANRRLFENLSVKELAAEKYDFLKFMKVNFPDLFTEIGNGDKLRKSQLERMDEAGAKWLAQRGQESGDGKRT